MISVIRGDDSPLASHCFDHSQGDVVGFGACARQNCGRQVVVKGCRQAFDIIQNAVMGVTCMGVECRSLLCDGFNHVGVTVPNVRNIIVAI